MSMDFGSHHGGVEYKSFREITRQRLLVEMLRSTKTMDSSEWKVLIMDKFTTKVMSSTCKMADITDEGVSLVEDIGKRRQPLPALDAVYFVQPTRENVLLFLSDMSGESPRYRKASIFFSSTIEKEIVGLIKHTTSVLPRLGSVCEVSLEYLTIDSQGFITDHERALEEFFSENSEDSQKYSVCLTSMAVRIATVFASLKEFPVCRFRAPKTIDTIEMTTFRDLIPSKLAAEVWNCLSKYKSTLKNFPQTETCELLILDRSIDKIAPVIHEWTYDAMCHDLLTMDGNKYIYEVPRENGSSVEKKEVILEDHDPLWLELRDVHIADASERLSDRMDNFLSKNKAAQIYYGRGSTELTTSQLQKIVQALPQYSDQIEKLSLHVEIAGKINSIIKEQDLKSVGKLEQDLVFGDADTKDLINFLRTKLDISRECKLRLLMIYASTNPERFESDTGTKLMQLAGLSPDDKIAIKNLHYLTVSENKKSSAGKLHLTFNVHKTKHANRQERPDEGAGWALSRFYPIIEDLVEKLGKGELSNDEYPCLNEPTSLKASGSFVNSSRAVKSKRTTAGNWAVSRNADDESPSHRAFQHVTSDKRMGNRIFVFIIGGATRSELRAVHKLTSKLNREVILGSTSLDDPPQFITKLKLISAAEELSVDELQI